MPKLELPRVLRGRSEVIATFTILQVIFVAGVIGFMVIEGYTFVEAFYMTSITLSTVGFGEVAPLSTAGRLFTIMLITVGVISIAAFVTAVTRALLRGQLDRYMGRRRLMKEIARLKNHFIVCGYGRMGRIICQELRKKGVPFVVIENNPTVFVSIEEEDLGLQGDATQDQVLIDAGIKKARGLVSVVSSDADNVYIILTARGLSGDAYLVARAGEEGSENKLLRAGADRVVSPYIIGGSQMANAILRPTVVDFIDLVTQSEHLELQMEEIKIRAGSSLQGSTLMDSGLRENWNIIVVAIKKGAGHMVFNPSHSTLIEEGDKLILLGDSESLNRIGGS